MKVNRHNTCLVALFLLLAPGAALSQDDIVMKAMRDELARSMKKLQLENLEKPYFISYSVYDTNMASASASFGSVNGRAEEQRSRLARIQVRVGDYKFDNRNFFSFSFGGSGVSRGFGGVTQLPVDDNYDEIRRQLWLGTDGAYKKALEDISKKRALLANKNRGEVIPDFSKEPAVTLSDVLPRADIKTPEMEKLVRDLSAIFKQSPDISTSSVSLRISNEFLRYVNSEGSSSAIRQPEIQLSISTSSQAADGQPLSAGIVYRTRSMSDLPSRTEIVEKIRLRSKQIAELRTAPLPDSYAGPVLFEGEAAPEIVFRTFMPHLLATPEILVDNPQFRSMVAQDSENLVEKIGLRVLPEFLSLVDDPETSSFGAERLLGAYKVDSEGVRTRRVQVVQNGLLMKLLTGRAPVHGISQSSGSYHSGGVAPSNVIVTSGKSLSLDELRAELLRRAKLRGKDYAIIVRKIDFSTRGADSGGLAPGSMAVLLAYKRFADGHEEPIRNAIINGINFGSFKDILAVSDSPAVWSASYTPRTTNPLEPPGNNFVSLVIPALLFEDAAVQKPTGSVNKPPFVEHPYFSKN
jgi:PmbA/TldA metallopeptidase C-terminal domain